LGADRRNVLHHCLPEIGKTILDSISWRNENHIWFCELALLMPDHVHLILNFPENVTMTKTMRDWKSWLAKVHEISWQENFFDHRLRNDENFNQKAEYILQNPVRAGYVEKPADWPYVWISSG
jgi:putative transposase